MPQLQGIAYNYSDGSTIKYCYKCNDCLNTHFAENGSCHLCNVKYPNCAFC
jgi:hypothetical protein